MVKLLAGFVAVVALTMLGHVVLVQTSKGQTSAAHTAQSTCASCHG